ncbi:MAG: winged helix-turn-helix domain-containing protein [Caldimonas sp.]
MLRESSPLLATADRLVLGEFVLDIAGGELLDPQGRPAELRAQALKLLIVLGERAGQVVAKEELLRRVWGDVVVTEDSLVQAIGAIRRTLGDEDHALLRTVPRRGYLLVANPADAETPSVAAPAAAVSPVTPRHPPAWAAVALAVVAVFAVLAATLLPPKPSESHRSLAILPFESDDVASADAWFVDAITSDLNTMVARWPAPLRVVGRGTMQVYKGKGADPRAVGRELGVAHVLTGRVRREGKRVRIAIELVEAENGQVLWARPFDVDRAELPGSVGDIAGGLAKALNIELGDALMHGRRLDPAQADADDLSMHAFSVLLKSLGPDNLERARQLFEQAIARDPQSLRALAGVSLTNSMSVSFDWARDPAASMRRSREALDQLEAIDSDAHLTLVSRASFHLSNSDWQQQLAASEELVRSFPNDPTSHHHRCSSLLRLGRFDEAIPACDRAIRISPQESRTPIWHGLAGMNEFMRGNYPAAAERAGVTAAANANLPFYTLLVAVALAHSGRPDEAKQSFASLRARHPDYETKRIFSGWRTANADPRFVAGLERIAATARELGLP